MNQPTNLAALREQQAPAKLADMKPKDQVAYLLNKKRDELQKMLPKTLSIDRLLKVAQIAATTTPALAKCDVPSLVGAIGQCAQMGLEPNTVLGHAYLVPFNTKRKDEHGNDKWVNSVQVIIGYKGLIDLARRSGQIISIAAHEVCEKDSFKLVYGIDEKLEHTPCLGERGPVIGFYAVAKLQGGGYAFEFMTVPQVLSIRDASQGWQQALKYNKQNSHPWHVHFVEMGRKTAIRRLAKYLPLSIEFQTAVALDEAATTGQEQRIEAFDGEFMVVPEGEEDAPDPAPVGATSDNPAPAPRATRQRRAAPEPEAPPPAPEQPKQPTTEGVTFAWLKAKINAALEKGDRDLLDAHADLIPQIEDEDEREELFDLYRRGVGDGGPAGTQLSME